MVNQLSSISLLSFTKCYALKCGVSLDLLTYSLVN